MLFGTDFWRGLLTLGFRGGFRVVSFRTGGFWAFLGLGPRPFGGGSSKESTMVIRCLLEGSTPAGTGSANC